SQERSCQVPTTPGMTCPQLGRTVTVVVPVASDHPGLALWASGTLRVNDRARVESASGAPARVANVGEIETNIGADAVVGDVRSVASVVLRERALVGGVVQTGGTLQVQNGVLRFALGGGCRP